MKEIERKFLVNKNKWIPIGNGIRMKQGYLSVDPERTVRVRIMEPDAFLTIKGKTVGITRTEIEYKITIEEATVLLDMCMETVIEKTRFLEKRNSVTWEIDVFEGANRGLIMAEVELTDEKQDIYLPVWIEKEVSNDHRYFNSWLSQNPYIKW